MVLTMHEAQAPYRELYDRLLSPQPQRLFAEIVEPRLSRATEEKR